MPKSLPRPGARVVRCLMLGAAYASILSIRANGAEFSWVPISVDVGPLTFGTATNMAGEPVEIVLDAGVDYLVEWELRLNGWGQAPGAPTLGAFQTTLDSQGLKGSHPPNLANGTNDCVDLLPFCAPNCASAAFQILKRCSGAPFAPCQTNPECSPGFCIGNTDFVFDTRLDVAACSTSTPNYSCLGVSDGNCTPDGEDGATSRYGSSLVFVVPAAARGKYTFGFDPAAASTAMADCGGNPIPGLVRTPGQVTIVCECSDGAVTFRNPENGITDAGQPHPINDANTPQGIDMFRIIAPADAGCCWSFCETDAGGTNCTVSADTVFCPILLCGVGEALYEIVLDHPLQAGAVTTINYTSTSGTTDVTGTFKALPGDVDAGGQTNTADIAALMDCLDSGACGPLACDIDRLGQCTAADVAREMDLLNAAGQFASWDQATPADDCPCPEGCQVAGP